MRKDERREINLEPKVLGVLIVLLESAGELVQKEELMNRVWFGAEVGDESLGRCVYILRRLLRDNRDEPYIDTVYGKGYRFRRPVAKCQAVDSEPTCSVAIFPFSIDGNAFDPVALHDMLIQCLSRYTSSGLAVLPASLTRECNEPSQIIALVDRMRPDYYLTGQSILAGVRLALRVELVSGKDHRLTHRDSIDLSEYCDIASVQRRLAYILPQRIPGLRWSGSNAVPMASLDLAVTWLTAQQALREYTPQSLRQALSLFQRCLSVDPSNAPTSCGIAECYLALSSLGLFDQREAMRLAEQAARSALALEPGNATALALFGLVLSLRRERAIAQILFGQAALLNVGTAAVHYLHAWHCFLHGHTDAALTALESCLSIDPSNVAAIVLKVRVLFCGDAVDAAITYGERELRQHARDHPVLQWTLAPLLAWRVRALAARQLAGAAGASVEEGGVLWVNHAYVNLLQDGEHGRERAASVLSRLDERQIGSAVLPLVMQLEGIDAASRMWRRLESQGCPWLPLARNDPRLACVAAQMNPVGHTG
ncbi:winged helix-turn-helix domain-containing protein [Burkholderia ubonensis]|uniref:winged helix-turn-helix domain-containing protein n=1 Tax=Burkholderia ubonensis TaxID=101571 RepID=UPI00075ACD6F|nr:winged helix-turn-helix domain-containing protein [Burkholderia ubonensis]KVN41162.1 hypothetical protein WJ64_32680 [Burkholderia ubonensis]